MLGSGQGPLKRPLFVCQKDGLPAASRKLRSLIPGRVWSRGLPNGEMLG